MKYPRLLEKRCNGPPGRLSDCLLAKRTRCRAIRTPMIVTRRAAIFTEVGMVSTGVLGAVVAERRKRPVTMLPQASRLIGLITAGLFSLIGEEGLNRGYPQDTM